MSNNRKNGQELLDTLAEAPGLTANILTIKSGLVLEAKGDLDLATGVDFASHYEQVETELLKAPGDQMLVIDLRNLDFIDSSGISQLINITNALRSQDRRCGIVLGKHSQPARVLAFSSFARILNITHDFDDTA